MRPRRLVALMLLMSVVGVTACSPDPDQTLINRAEQSVKQQLNDPDSAEFSEIKIVGPSPIETVCGRVNAKNLFGGYVGYRRFYFYASTGASVIESALNARAFNVMWELCSDKQKTSN
jgi:hypothetical protein